MNLTVRSTRLVTAAGLATAVLAATVLAATGLLVPAVTASAAPAPAVSPVPAKFKAASLSWLSAQRGWALGSAPCAKKTCSYVISTSNGGRSWNRAGQVNEHITTAAQDSKTGVGEIRRSSATTGWAFDPSLFRTTDSGKTWTSRTIPGGGKQVVALASGPAGLYLVTSACAINTGACHKSLTLWRSASLAGSSWTKAGLKLNPALAASIAISGTTVYVLNQDVTPDHLGSLYAATDGRHFSARPSPCLASDDLVLTQVVPTSATHVALLCTGDPGFSKAVKTVYRSYDTGRTTTSAGTTGPLGIDSDLAVSPAGRLVVGAWSNGTYLYLNSTHKKSWQQVETLGDGGAGLDDLAFTSTKVAWAVYGPVNLFAADFGKLYVTRDGGQHWAIAKI